MKLLLVFAVTLFLLGCKRETPITPSSITSIEYGINFGFTGAVTKLTVYPRMQVVKPDFRSEKTCEIATAIEEWNELISLFDEEAFKKVKIEKEMVCPDAGSAWIIVHTTQREIEAVWGPCTGGDPTGIQPLINVLGNRLKAMPECK